MGQSSQARQLGAEESESNLLQRVVARDRLALEELYRNYQPRLTRFLSRLTQRQEILDEAINDTLWVVWNSASGFRGRSRISSWVMGIAYRCALKALRRSAYGVPVEELSPWLSDDSVQRQQAARELHDSIGEGLRKLSPVQSTTMELAYYHGYSCDEIAEIMECCPSTVKARMFHARSKLRVLLRDLDGDTSPTRLETSGPPSDCSTARATG